ncbi:flagellar hook-associated protein FlgL [Paenibacillus wulumuqiensis]|uniref:flagellar hook-associated protein FlgL n=1 Tax=Paenibacillus wulumuqiensis TaxID=1567107 RepID=UPI0006190DF4|nr:flagellar hook-associated protein FlgL [Paenibacillus wulumuqiensis]
MAIRITSNMMSSQSLRNLNSNRATLDKLSDQSSSGRKINKPSDDPVGTTYALRYRAELAANDQYLSNTDEAKSWLDYSDTVMGQAGDVMTRIKELAIQAGAGTTDIDGLKAIQSEVTELKNQLVNIGNSQLNGKYIFNGQELDQPPYQLSGTVTNYSDVVTDTGGVTYGISEGVSIDVNVTGNEFFGSKADTDNVFATLDRLNTALTNGDHEAITKEISNIESRKDKMVTSRAEIGAKTNRVDLINNRLDDRRLNVTTLQARVEDADITETLIKTTTAQTVYQAALQTSASVMQMSLVNFLK